LSALLVQAENFLSGLIVSLGMDHLVDRELFVIKEIYVTAHVFLVRMKPATAKTTTAMIALMRVFILVKMNVVKA
jgi:prephenate dehydratase